jgi:hypothetical protein
MRSFHFILGIVISLSVLTSCEQVVDVDLPANTVKLVVEGQITTEKDSSFVRLTKSLAFFDNTSSIPLVTNATVDVNGIPFVHDTLGIYRPAKNYVGTIGQVYNLKINHEGKEYTSSSLLEPMFQIDTIIPVFKEQESFLEEGYTVKYLGIDNRSPVKYTYVRFGFNNIPNSYGQDSLFDFRVLFDNRNSVLNAPFEFEIPFLRLEPGDTSLLIFRSVDDGVYRYLLALNNRSEGGGPFSTPPANLPSNIRGGDVLGIFAAYDIKRFRTRIVER